MHHVPHMHEEVWATVPALEVVTVGRTMHHAPHMHEEVWPTVPALEVGRTMHHTCMRRCDLDLMYSSFTPICRGTTIDVTGVRSSHESPMPPTNVTCCACRAVLAVLCLTCCVRSYSGCQRAWMLGEVAEQLRPVPSDLGYAVTCTLYGLND